MSVPELPRRSIKLYTKDLIQASLASTFNRRLDIIMPGSAGAGGAQLGVQVAGYSLVSDVRLADLFEDGFIASSDMQVVTIPDEDGAWFIDGQQGRLVLKVTKERYESIGVVGSHIGGAYIVGVNLQEKASGSFARARNAFEKWEKPWQVWVLGTQDVFPNKTRIHREIVPVSVVLENVFVPSVPSLNQEQDEAWTELFEWIGLCSLGARGSPRIRCQDQVNPYVACYSPPENSRASSVVRFRWEGPISEIFVRKCIRIAKEEDGHGLVAFSVQPIAHVTAPDAALGRETRAGVGFPGGWVMAEIM